MPSCYRQGLREKLRAPGPEQAAEQGLPLVGFRGSDAPRPPVPRRRRGHRASARPPDRHRWRPASPGCAPSTTARRSQSSRGAAGTEDVRGQGRAGARSGAASSSRAIVASDSSGLRLTASGESPHAAQSLLGGIAAGPDRPDRPRPWPAARWIPRPGRQTGRGRPGCGPSGSAIAASLRRPSPAAESSSPAPRLPAPAARGRSRRAPAARGRWWAGPRA